MQVIIRRNTFKQLSSLNGVEIFTVTSNCLLEFLQHCNVYDSLYQSSDMGVNWNATVQQIVKGQQYNPGGALVRYEFMEILVRIAHDKYVRTKTCDKNIQAIQTLFTNHLIDYMQTMDFQTWRNDYLTEDIDLTLKLHLPILKALFKRFSGRKTLPGKKPFTCLDEFRDLCNEAGMINDHFVTREVDLCYNLAMMTRVDELYCKTHLEMSFVEFLEAIARVSDLACIQADSNVSVQNFSSTLQARIFSAMRQFYKICSYAVQQNFTFPSVNDIEALKIKAYTIPQKIMLQLLLNSLDMNFVRNNMYRLKLQLLKMDQSLINTNQCTTLKIQV